MFRSVGNATYINDLAQDAVATLSGNHEVRGPVIFQHPVQSSTGKYDYILEGPTSPGACYGTSLYVKAVPPSGTPGGTKEATFPGNTACAPSATGGGGSGDTDNECREDSCSPLVLDLNGDGIRTTSISNPVVFDIDGDGDLETMGWTDPTSVDAFLWIDNNTNGAVDNGAELFGIGTVLPDGRRASNGFEALSVLDQVAFGGDGSGFLSAADSAWGRLRLWFDENHDGLSQPTEVGPIHRYGALTISLQYSVDTTPDENGNVHKLRGSYVRRIATEQARIATLALHDVFFRTTH